MSTKIFIILLGLSLAGCATQRGTWYHPNKSLQEFYADRARCATMGNSAGSPQILPGQGIYRQWNIVAAMDADDRREQIFQDCMYGEGWQVK